MSLDSLSQLIVRSAQDNDVSIHNFSGRFMYGKKCLGISCNQIDALKRTLVEVQQTILDNVVDASLELEDNSTSEDFKKFDMLRNQAHTYLRDLSEFQTDSMGLGEVWYWKRLENLVED